MTETGSGTGGAAMTEKRGNTCWVQCPKCSAWHHVAPDLLRSTHVKMHCPSCHFEFFAAEAQAVIDP